MSALNSLLSELGSGLSWWGVLLLLVLGVSAYWYLTIPRGIPPGPKGLPIVGSLPFLPEPIQKGLAEIGKKYGSVFSVYLGSQLVIVLNDWESTKAAFVQQAENFSARPKWIPFYLSPRAQFNIEVSDGEFWREHRRFAVHTIRDFGLGKSSLEPNMMEEVQRFLDEVEKFAKSRKPVDLTELFITTLTNCVSIVSAGKRYEYSDSKIQRIHQLSVDFINKTSYKIPLFCFPYLKVIPGIKAITGHNDVVKIQEGFLDEMGELVDDHQKTHKHGQKEDFIHAFLTEKAERLKKDPNENFFTDEAAVDVTGNFFDAGTILPIALKWALVYLMKYPEIQKKMQKEVDDVVGKDRHPSFEDRKRTPNVEAFILEVLRHAPIFPINTPHSNYKETSLLGYRIPKRSYILNNIWYIHNDPKLWGDPEVFRPERFITESGKVTKPEYFMIFSCGKRMCPGNLLALMQFYLYLTAMLQRFTFTPADKQSIDLDSEDSMLNFPKCIDSIIIALG